MKERERHHDESERPADAAAGGAPNPDLRQQVERLLAAGNDIIDRALSDDSEAFLDGNRQEGGQ
jgi:hypothetical protein